MIGVLAAAVVAAAPLSSDWQPTPAQDAQLAKGAVVVEMAPDPDHASGVIRAAIEVRAPVKRLWALLTDCAEAPKLVKFVKACRVITGPGPAGGWDLREDTVETAFFLPHIRTVFRSAFTKEQSIVFHCVPGSEPRVCDGAWRLTPTAGGAVRVTYASVVSSPYPVPDFIIRQVLRGEMADSLKTLRRVATAPDGAGRAS